MDKKRVTIVGCISSLGLILCGCSADQWSRLGDRLIDGMTMNVGMDADGEMQVGLGFSSELADARAQDRESAQLKGRLMQSAIVEMTQNQTLEQNEALRRMVREIIAAEMFGEGTDFASGL